MRTTPGAIATRLMLLGGVVAGALAGTRHVTGRPLDAITSAACVAHLPGTAARCESDRFIAQSGPFIGPAIVGGLAGLLVALLVIAVVGALFRFATTGRRPVAAVSGTPAWVLAPIGDRCSGCGARLGPEVMRHPGARCSGCGGRTAG